MDSGENGRVSYSITFGNIGNTFGIDEDTGWLALNRPLSLRADENFKEYVLTVKATDNGSPQALSATTNVNVFVTLASNEEKVSLRCTSGGTPQITSSGRQEMRVRVMENSPVGTYVTTIKVDSVGSVSFEIEENQNNLFWIDPITGVILVGKNSRLLDREISGTHELMVRAFNLVSTLFIYNLLFFMFYYHSVY